MLDLSLISPQLQVKVAEKIGLFDQREFELSSKRGKHLVSVSKQKPVFDVFELGMDETDFYFQIEVPGKEDKKQQKWSEISQIRQDLPRFKVHALLIWAEVPYASLQKLTEQCIFVNNKVGLKIIGRTPNLQIFTELAENFKINRLKLDERPYSELVRLPWFSELEEIITVIIDDVPDSVLVNLKASTLQLSEKSESSRLCPLSNTYFQQWVQKTRSIDYLCIYTEKDGRSNTALDEKVLMADLSFSKVTSGVIKATLTGKNIEERRRTFKIDEEGGIAYIIDRGDKTLLISSHEARTFNLLYAQEVTDVVVNC